MSKSRRARAAKWAARQVERGIAPVALRHATERATEFQQKRDRLRVGNAYANRGRRIVVRQRR